MKENSINSLLFAIETGVFGLGFIAFLVLNFLFDLSADTANIIYIIFMLFSFGWLFSYEFVFKKYDNAVHYKMYAKYYKPVPNSVPKKNYRRKGIAGIIILWIAYLGFIFLIKFFGILTWELFLAGACIMFMLNSFFARKKCLLSVIFLRNKNNCCKNCGINCWDYLIFASALIFAPYMSVTATVINYVIIGISVVMFIIWEYNYKKYPFRFYPETNMTLSCKYCLKKCKYKK